MIRPQISIGTDVGGLREAISIDLAVAETQDDKTTMELREVNKWWTFYSTVIVLQLKKTNVSLFNALVWNTGVLNVIDKHTLKQKEKKVISIFL